MGSEMDAAAWYPIGAVARKTGLSVHTLRAWERRYGVVTPQRSAGGTRLYSNADVTRLRLLRRATEAGHPIGQVAPLPAESLRELLREELQAEPMPRPFQTLPPREGSATLVEEIMRAVEVMDGPRIHALLMQAVVALPVERVLQGVIVPVLRQVGDRWAAGAICPANEHLLSVNVRRVLAWLTESVPVPEGAPALLVTTPAGHWHELGAQIAGVIAAEAGWRVIFLGSNLPADAIARAVRTTEAGAVLLGATMVDEEVLFRELEELRQHLPAGIPVYIGGRGAEPYEHRLEEQGVTYMPSFEALSEALRGAGLRPVGSSA
jgi:MerR family transcriptional regulator, light-induced transcriptional regulator